MHVIGAGLAGLSAAVAVAETGRSVTVVEAGPTAGGRCRSYFDREIGLRIDNGNHLLLSGNRSTFRYIDTIGARDTLDMPAEPIFPFLELSSGLRWTLRPNLGRLPWWVLSRKRRTPGTRAPDYLSLLKLRRVDKGMMVAASLPHDLLYHRLIEPLAVAALNTPPELAQAQLLGAVMRETLFQGGAACIPAVPRDGLSESLIDPAIAWLRARDSSVITGRRVLGLRLTANTVTALETTEDPMPVAAVVLAVPPWAATSLLPGIQVPTEFQAILNIHFRVEAERGPVGFMGLVGGTAEWLFVKRGHVSVTISAANRMVDDSAEAIANAVWPDVKAALALRCAMPPWRVVKERRATFAATPEQAAHRSGTRTRLDNLVLAGDWTATGLPATIEGAIRSGRTAAEALLAA